MVRNADSLEDRGFGVRQRAERRKVGGGTWEFRDSGGEVGIHKVP